MAFAEFEHLQEHMDRMFERLTGGPPGHPRFRAPVIEPPTDVYQTDTAVVVVIEIAGMRGRDIEMSIADGRLLVRGEKQDPHPFDQHTARQYSQMEIARGPFECRVPLPALVDAEQTAIRYEDGMLEITMPKRQAAPAQRIKLTVRGQ